MKKTNFITLILVVIGMLCFSLGMVMCLIPEWGLANQGIVTGAIGLFILLISLLLYWKMTNQQPLKLNAKIILFTLIAIVGALLFGRGMSYTMLTPEYTLKGIIIGIVGLLICIFVYPVYRIANKNNY